MTQFFTIGSLLRLVRDTVVDPREGATTVLSVAPSRQALWLMFALVVVLSMLLGELMNLISPLPEDGPITGAYERAPLLLGLVQAGFLFIMIHAVHQIGRWFGGAGQFEEALILIVWLQFVFICVQVIQLAALMILPAMVPFITMLALGLFFWLLINFIAVLHGFTSLGMVFVMTILSGFGVMMVLAFILALLGLTPDMAIDAATAPGSAAPPSSS